MDYRSFRKEFLPNGDAKNEVFVIKNIEFFPDNNLKIYNRWGEELLSLSNYDNTIVSWSGDNENGDELPEGTYFAILLYKNNGSEYVLKGYVDIRR